VDVGSGGGLPGIVLALCRPDLQVDSVETVQKKATFQNQAKIELKLRQLPRPPRPHRSLAARPTRRRPPTASSPAPFPTWPTSSISPPTWPARRPGMLAMKGVYPADEIARIPAGFQLEHSVPLAVPGLDAERHLLTVKRT
jgi:16S rRNA (guanine527-N7)-methyltransferase